MKIQGPAAGVGPFSTFCYWLSWMLMFAKIVALASLLVLPLSLSMWRKSHRDPEHFRFDLTVYKSLWVYVQDGTCGLNLLSMPTKTASRTEFRAPLARMPQLLRSGFAFTSVRQGPYRVTWIVFPFWFPTGVLVIGGAFPVVRGPVRRQWRRWRGACAECGYSLLGNRSGRCPECGTTFHSARRSPKVDDRKALR